MVTPSPVVRTLSCTAVTAAVVPAATPATMLLAMLEMRMGAVLHWSWIRVPQGLPVAGEGYAL